MTQLKTLTVFVGLPASGKSTRRSSLLGDNTYVYSPDDLIDAYAIEQNSTYDAEFKNFVKIAHKRCDENLVDAIKNGNDIVWDQTNMSVKKRRSILNRFKKSDGYISHCVCFLPPYDMEQTVELARRLHAREGKHIPSFVMQTMRNSFVLPTMFEDFNQITYVDIYNNEVLYDDALELYPLPIEE